MGGHALTVSAHAATARPRRRFPGGVGGGGSGQGGQQSGGDTREPRHRVLPAPKQLRKLANTWAPLETRPAQNTRLSGAQGQRKNCWGQDTEQGSNLPGDFRVRGQRPRGAEAHCPP